MSSLSCDVCGWAAAVCSMLAFGSFGVPIKSNTCRELNIDPLVFQSYKSIVCFLTSWLVLVAGEELRFSWWGIVSAMFWVPGGCATIYAVQAAGLAVGIGVGSSFIVLVSFIWGVFVFQEHVHSKLGACGAIACLMLGLLGMAVFSSPDARQLQDVLQQHDDDVGNEDGVVGLIRLPSPPASPCSSGVYQGLRSGNDEDEHAAMVEIERKKQDELIDSAPPSTTNSDSGDKNVEDGDLPDADENDGRASISSTSPTVSASGSRAMLLLPTDRIQICFGCCTLTRRQCGILAAIFCGVWGGSILAPMRWAPDDAKGTGYLISFSVGALVVTMVLWMLRLAYYCWYYSNVGVAWRALPSFHVRRMWLPGGLAGCLWSIGNYFSLIAVFYLGEGVGYPLVQTSILVAGLWGIFYFHEVQGWRRISRWLLSSCLTVAGILWLSYEHHAKR